MTIKNELINYNLSENIHLKTPWLGKQWTEASSYAFHGKQTKTQSCSILRSQSRHLARNT